MQYQVYGQGTAGEEITITARNVGGFLELHVTGPDAKWDTDSKYNGLYYRAPAANIKSLIIRGSDDKETIIIEGPLGLTDSGAITIESRDGNDQVFIQGAAPNAFGTIRINTGTGDDKVVLGFGNQLLDPLNLVYVDGGPGTDEVTFDDTLAAEPKTYVLGTTLNDPPGAGYQYRFAIANKPQVVYNLGLEKYTILAGSKADVVRIDAAGAPLGTHVYGNSGDDDIFIGSTDKGLADVTGLVYVVGGADDGKLTYRDTVQAAAKTYVLGKSDVAGYDMRFAVDGGPQVIHSIGITRYEIQAGTAGDTVRIDAVSPAATRGTHVFGNGGDDTIRIDTDAGGLGPAANLAVYGGAAYDKVVVVSGDIQDPLLAEIERLDITGGKLTLATHGVAVQHLSQTGGTLDGAATATASNWLMWSGGTMQGAGKTVSLNTSTLTLTGSSTLTRTLENQGVGNWNGATISGGTGTLRNTGYLSGTGTLAGTLVNDGALLPGGAGVVGTITVQGAFSSAGTLAADLGATADLVAAQTVTLGGTLSPTAVAGFPAKSYTVIDNTGANPVNGTFAGLPEGTVLTVNGVRYQITYVGGDGNNVVLHAVVNIGNRVWEDFNLDGVQNEGTPNLPPVSVELFTPSHALVAQTMASAAGEYLFPNVRVGDYYLRFGLPGDGWYKFTRQDWTDDALDSDADRATGKTDVFALSPGQDDLTRDAGVYKLGTVGDLVWLDYYIGGDGIQMMPPDGGPIGGLTVTLVSTPSGYGGVTISDSYGYLFEKVELVDANWNPISYRVQFTKPPNGGYSKYAFSPMDQGTDDALDSDADPATGLTGSFTLPTSGAINRTIDCGIQYSQFSGGGYFAAPDQGSEGYPDGLAVRGRVWEDEDGDGVRDPSEPAVAKWRVGLYTADGELVAETRTGADGAYEFAGVAAGLYRVRFDPPGAGRAFTPRNQGTDDALDSDADPDGYSPFFANVNPGPWVAAIDAGLVRTGGRLRSMPLPAGGTSDPEATSAGAGEPAPAPQWIGIDPFGLWGDDKEDDPTAVGAVVVG